PLESPPLESPPLESPPLELSSSANASRFTGALGEEKRIVDETGAVTIGTDIASINNNTGI
ncbi:MAG: hypothetical protein L0H53_10625, partial [Candidatus Nitrosocosmicus sp.]|nr:hypothetical protein [Candidatus Nitrosocosmicus sp.]